MVEGLLVVRKMLVVLVMSRGTIRFPAIVD